MTDIIYFCSSPIWPRPWTRRLSTRAWWRRRLEESPLALRVIQRKSSLLQSRHQSSILTRSAQVSCPLFLLMLDSWFLRWESSQSRSFSTSIVGPRRKRVACLLAWNYQGKGNHFCSFSFKLGQIIGCDKSRELSGMSTNAGAGRNTMRI